MPRLHCVFIDESTVNASHESLALQGSSADAQRTVLCEERGLA